MKRGDVYFADLSPVMGSEQGGVRPVLIIQNDVGNRFSPTVIVAAISTQVHKLMPTHVRLAKEKYNLKDDSIACLEQIRTIDKNRLTEDKYCTLDVKDMKKIEEAIMISVGLIEPKKPKNETNFNTLNKKQYALA